MDAPRKPKRGIWLVAVLVALPIASCGACGGYAALKVHWAKATVGAFCDEDVAVGGPVAGLAAKARARHLNVVDMPPGGSGASAKPGTLMVWEGFAFARHFCDVDHDGTTVLSKRTSSLD